MNFKVALMCSVVVAAMSATLAHPLTKLKTVALVAGAVGSKLGFKAGAHHEHVVGHAVHVEPFHHHHVQYAPVVHHVEHAVEFEPIIGKPSQPLVNVNDVITLLGAGTRIVKQKAVGLISALNPVGIVQRVAHVAGSIIEAKKPGVVHEHVVEHVPAAYAHVTNHVEYAPVPVSLW